MSFHGHTRPMCWTVLQARKLLLTRCKVVQQITITLQAGACKGAGINKPEVRLSAK